MTGARYAALGVLGEERNQLEQFLTSGVEERVRGQIGDPPHGRGVLGVLVSDPRPLRLADVSKHPRSYGFPEGHPAMRSFLGVPIVIRGRAWGNLYLTEKQGATEFTDVDEQAVVVLADLAGVAIENARLYTRSEDRREQLERAVRGLEATRDVAVTIGGEAGEERVLEVIAKRGRALIEARAVLIMLRDGPDLVVVASAGYASDVRGHRLPIADSTSGQVLERRVPERVAQVGARLRIAPAELGIPDAHTALLVPMLHRGTALGVLAAFDRGEAFAPFTAADEELLQTFAASAANAVAITRSVASERLRASLAAADAERSRWARELHDDTLQIFGGLRVLLAGALRRGDPARYEAALREAIDTITLGIEGLRAIIADLRPAALDEIGLKPALDALLARRESGTVRIVARLRLPDPARGDVPLDPEIETTVYRLVQEALTNIIKHSGARTAWVEVESSESGVSVDVRDDGAGFDPSAFTSGYGLAGMRERVYLVGGTIDVQSDVASGTHIRAALPRHRDIARLIAPTGESGAG
jgi:signal transduction histidine kinase